MPGLIPEKGSSRSAPKGGRVVLRRRPNSSPPERGAGPALSAGPGRRGTA